MAPRGTVWEQDNEQKERMWWCTTLGMPSNQRSEVPAFLSGQAVHGCRGTCWSERVRVGCFHTPLQQSAHSAKGLGNNMHSLQIRKTNWVRTQVKHKRQGLAQTRQLIVTQQPGSLLRGLQWAGRKTAQRISRLGLRGRPNGGSQAIQDGPEVFEHRRCLGMKKVHGSTSFGGHTIEVCVCDD